VAEWRRERKVVTVLFADLVGFTSRAETLDPEDDAERAVRAALAIRDAIVDDGTLDVLPLDRRDVLHRARPGVAARICLSSAWAINT